MLINYIFNKQIDSGNPKLIKLALLGHGFQLLNPDSLTCYTCKLNVKNKEKY